MSILGIVVRTPLVHRLTLKERLAQLPGCELGPDAGDGRLVAVLESVPGHPAAATMGDIAQWPEVHNVSLVFEHSDPDESASTAPALDFRGWRQDVGEFARRQAAEDAARAAATDYQPVPMSAPHGAGEPR